MSTPTNEVTQNNSVYKKAKTLHVALATMTGAGQMVFYILMSAATYIGNSNYGILVAVTGIIITCSRLLDGVTDPLIAYFLERYEGKKLGKCRFSILVGWFFMALATTIMCNVGPRFGLEGVGGIVFFIVCYAVYIIGYTFVSIAGAINANILTNDPKQRPTIAVWNVAYSYLTPMIMSMVSMVVILPKYGNIQGTGYFKELNMVVCVVSLVFYILACIGIAPYDIPENYANIKPKEEDSKPTLKDMWNLVKENKELQRYIAAASSDKLAQVIGSASVVSTMLFGIMLGSMAMSTILSAVSMLPSIIFAVIGSKIAGKKGNKAVMISWTKICIVINICYAAFLLFAPVSSIGGLMSGRITAGAILMGLAFMLFNFGNSSAKMVVSVATNSIRMDVTDYELDRTGRYMPATVSSTYSFIDKIISAFGATIATAFVGIIGYTTAAPQQGDPLTTGVKVVTVILLIGFPLIGWICTLVAMKNSKLTLEKMEEVQINIAEKKAALIASGEAK